VNFDVGYLLEGGRVGGELEMFLEKIAEERWQVRVVPSDNVYIKRRWSVTVMIVAAWANEPLVLYSEPSRC
jgi:hypothetical protein